MRLLITGASGFIGRNLAGLALEQGHEVVGTYLTRDELQSPGVPTPRLSWRPLQIQDRDQVSKLVEEVRPEGVFHLAAQAYAQRAWKDPADTFRTNVLGTIYLYEALREHPPKHGTLLSASGSEYGVPPRLPISEDFALNPTNPYGVSKACQEMLSYQYYLNFDLRIVRARLFGTTGPGKTGDALNDFARQVAQLEEGGTPGKLRVGNLGTRRDVSDIRDVVQALWRIFEAGDPGQPINIGAGKSHTIRSIAETLVRLARVPLELSIDPTLLRPTDEPENLADISRLRALGYTPTYSLERTIEDSLNHWRNAIGQPGAKSGMKAQPP